MSSFALLRLFSPERLCLSIQHIKICYNVFLLKYITLFIRLMTSNVMYDINLCDLNFKLILELEIIICIKIYEYRYNDNLCYNIL